MKVLIISSASIEIDPFYTSIARSIAHYLANNNCDLIYGGCSTSMMGICYEEFLKRGREIYAYTTPKYGLDLDNLNCKEKEVLNTTFDLKKIMYEQCDFVVCLPGGIGTISEIFSYIEENRSNDKHKPIIIYDENNYYEDLLKLINRLQKEKFLGEISDLYYATSKSEFKAIYEQIEGEKIYGNGKTSKLL